MPRTLSLNTASHTPSDTSSHPYFNTFTHPLTYPVTYLLTHPLTSTLTHLHPTRPLLLYLPPDTFLLSASNACSPSSRPARCFAQSTGWTPYGTSIDAEMTPIRVSKVSVSVSRDYPPSYSTPLTYPLTHPIFHFLIPPSNPTLQSHP